jgi:glycosyltransferase involved in cell wall biosynthesis
MKVTIGLPVYNAESFLPDTLRSIFAQTYRDWELIIVDDGSADGSLDIARAVQDSRVSVYSDGMNRGLPTRLNQITALAHGKYIARMDADDLMHPERIERQLAHLQSHPDIDVLGTAAYSIDLKNNPVGVRGLTTWPMTPRVILDQGPIIHASAIGKREWFLSNRYKGIYYRGEDRELFCRTHRYTTFAHLPEPLYLVREVGTVTLLKYVMTCSAQRRLILKFGREMVGTAGMLKLMLKTTIKELIYRFCFLIHTEQYVIARRNEPLTETQNQELLSIVRRIMSTRVPGLEESKLMRLLCSQA